MKTPIIEYKKILYVTDLSESGRATFPYAASIANRYDAELTVFHVVRPPKFEDYLVGYIDNDLWNEIKGRELEEARTLLASRKRDDAAIKHQVFELCQSTLVGHEDDLYVTYDIKIAMGDPVDEIVKEADESNYDLIVIGKRSRGYLEEAVMGTTARRVMRRCNRPVMVVPIGVITSS